MSIFRKRSTFTLPRIGIAGIVAILAVVLLGGMVIVLSVVDIRPPIRSIEQEIPRERFSR